MKKSHELFFKALFFSFVIGLSSSIFIYIFSDKILNLLYKTTLGNEYIKLLAIPYVLYYIESILNTTLHCINKEKISLKINIISSLIRVLLIIILIPLYGVIGIEYAMLISILLIIVLDFIFIRKYLFLNI